MVAGHIQDPVGRLRFLRAVARPPGAGAFKRRRAIFHAILAMAAATAALASLFLMRALARVEPATSPLPAPAPMAPSAEVWQVESNGDAEIYSNGLRIDNRFTIANHPRSYRAFPARTGTEGVRQTRPAGIVFHTTESRQAPFEAGRNGELKRIGEYLAGYVRRRRAYHFLIDRFGRVYRVVAESDAANHAGHSVWADRDWLYVNLNESFLGISFEARQEAVGPAQVRAAAMLTEMLRLRYGIPEGNCVTHAQVSVNPSNMRVGYHTDWAAGFPFTALNLPDNYARTLPALSDFGFEADAAFEQRAGPRLRLGIHLAEESLRRRAAECGMAPSELRRKLRERYRRVLGAGCQVLGLRGAHPAPSTQDPEPASVALCSRPCCWRSGFPSSTVKASPAGCGASRRSLPRPVGKRRAGNCVPLRGRALRSTC